MSQMLPVPRSLTHVLRTALTRGEPLRLLRCQGGAAFTEGTADWFNYCNVVVEGVELKTPRLAGTDPPVPGGPAYVLVTGDFLLCLGTVKATA